MSLKWIGALLVVAGSGGVGFSMAASYRREEQELRYMAAALDYMTCELQYRLTPLPELCRLAGKESGGCVSKLLKNLADKLESGVGTDAASCVAATVQAAGGIPHRLRQCFALLGTTLGRFDLEGQLSGLEAVRTHCRRELELLSAGRENRLRSFQTLGLCAGAALAILFV